MIFIVSGSPKGMLKTPENLISFNEVSLVNTTLDHWPLLMRIRVHADQCQFAPSPQSILRELTFKRATNSTKMHAVSIFHRNELAGLFTYLWSQQQTVWFGGFQVHQDFQATGIGKIALMRLFISLLETTQFQTIQLDVHRDNLNALRFYQRLGFRLLEMQQTSNNLTWQMEINRETVIKAIARYN